MLGPIFNKIIGTDWSEHLPRMYSFWDLVLLSAPGYGGNPVRKHVELDKNVTLNTPHFDVWITLWEKTVDELFEGELARTAKEKAGLMANLIRMKIEMSRDGIDLL